MSASGARSLAPACEARADYVVHASRSAPSIVVQPARLLPSCSANSGTLAPPARRACPQPPHLLYYCLTIVEVFKADSNIHRDQSRSGLGAGEIDHADFVGAAEGPSFL
jgi:hypothetical protein